MKFEINDIALRAVAAGVMVCVGGAAMADDESTPFSFTASEAVTRDSNFVRATNARSDYISQTDATVRIDKPYGRQNYTGNARFGISRFKNNSQYNNENYDVDGGFATEIASNWSFSLNGAGSRNLNSAENNLVNNRYDKNVLTTRNGNASLRYGVSGRWSLVGSYGFNKLSYSLLAQRYQNQDQDSANLQLVYSPSDLLSFGVGVGSSSSEYEYLRVGGEEIKQKSVNFSTNWQVTGFSLLSAVVSLNENKYRSDSAANYKAVTGRMSWKFTPRGLLSYELALGRTTDSDNSLTNKRTSGEAYTNAGIPAPVDTVYDNVTTSLNGTARWAATSKINVALNGIWYHYNVKRNQKYSFENGVLPDELVLINPSLNSASDFTQVALSASYRFSRAIGLGCNIQKYKQTADLTRVAFEGNAVGCNASFTID